jgi:hypothetical protein
MTLCALIVSGRKQLCTEEKSLSCHGLLPKAFLLAPPHPPRLTWGIFFSWERTDTQTSAGRTQGHEFGTRGSKILFCCVFFLQENIITVFVTCWWKPKVHLTVLSNALLSRGIVFIKINLFPVSLVFLHPFQNRVSSCEFPDPNQ